MDIYDETLDYLLRLPSVAIWGEMTELIKTKASKKPRHWILPKAACLAVGGTSDQAIPGVAAIGCFHTSLILLDDIMDNDPRGEFWRIGVGAAVNLAYGLQSAGFQTILLCEIDDKSKVAALNILSNMILASTFGQSQDSQNPEDEEAYWRIVRTKSSPFFSAAFQLGGVLGGASSIFIEQLHSFGKIYGELIQIYDDINDTLAVPASQDWILGRSSLPILFAQSVDHTDREYFLALRREVSNLEKLAEAQKILFRCGAMSYCIYEIQQRHQAARQLLADTQLARRAGLEGLLETMIEPVRRLLSTVGATDLEDLLHASGGGI